MIRYIAGKTNDTWYQKPPIARAAYKEKLGYDKCNICKPDDGPLSCNQKIIT